MKHPTCLANRRPKTEANRLPNRLHGGQKRLHSAKKGTASWYNGTYHYAVCNHLLGACNRLCNRFERPGALATTGRVTGVTTFSEKYRVRARRDRIEKVFEKGGYIGYIVAETGGPMPPYGGANMETATTEKVTEISKMQAFRCPGCSTWSYDQRTRKVCGLCGQRWYTRTEGR